MPPHDGLSTETRYNKDRVPVKGLYNASLAEAI